MSQQRATLCSRAAEDADRARAEAEKSRALAESRALDNRQQKELAVADKIQLGEELQLLRTEVYTNSSIKAERYDNNVILIIIKCSQHFA